MSIEAELDAETEYTKGLSEELVQTIKRRGFQQFHEPISEKQFGQSVVDDC